MKIQITKNGIGLELPTYATVGSAGMDLRAAIDNNVVLNPSERVLIPTGIKIALPKNFVADVRSRSGLALKNGIVVLNAPGTIDSDFRGEIGVILVNLGSDSFVIERGMRIAQLVILPYSRVDLEVVQELEDTDRSCGGYGSTGIK